MPRPSTPQPCSTKWPLCSPIPLKVRRLRKKHPKVMGPPSPDANLQSPLFELPLEIRHRIWSYAVTEDRPLYWRDSCFFIDEKFTIPWEPPLARLCHSAAFESRYLHYVVNDIIILSVDKAEFERILESIQDALGYKLELKGVQFEDEEPTGPSDSLEM